MWSDSMSYTHLKMPRSSALPPLAALRAFEAVARRLSFKGAAEELSVTPTAISHHIRQLEQFAGVRLLERSSRACSLTAAGASLAEATHAGFSQIRSAMANLRQGGGTSTLTISATPAFLGLWLVPRLQRLRDQLPRVDLRLYASKDPASLDSGDVDVAIRYATRRPEAGESLALNQDEYTPLCSPTLKLRSHADLKRATLLHVDGMRTPKAAPSWARWCALSARGKVDVGAGPRFTDSLQAAQAAIAAQGVYLGSPLLVAEHLQSGILVRPFRESLPGATYYFVSSRVMTGQRNVTGLKAWFQHHLVSAS
jgi:LysR family transcriptional regulator, glycine cleavage system transcriptional activator